MQKTNEKQENAQMETKIMPKTEYFGEKCPNGYYQIKGHCGNGHNCDPKVCRENRLRVALSTKGDN